MTSPAAPGAIGREGGPETVTFLSDDPPSPGSTIPVVQDDDGLLVVGTGEHHDALGLFERGGAVEVMNVDFGVPQFLSEF